MKPKRVLILAIIAMLALSTGCPGGNYTDNSRDSDTTNNIYPPPPPVNCPTGQTPVVLWHDGDNDGLAEPGYTITVCLGSTADVPPGWTDNNPCDANGNNCHWDPCPNDPANTCGTSEPSIQITAVVNGHTVTITADPHYTSGYTTQVVFYSGVVQIGSDSSTNDGWHFTWTNVAAGTYTVCAMMWTNDGKHATSNSLTVTIGNGQCVPMLRCSWAYNTPSTVKYFNGISTSCYASWAGQDPNWQWSTFRSCHDPSDGCVIEDEIYASALNAGQCEFNDVVPQFLNGNPENPFGVDKGYLINWSVTEDGNGGAYNALATGYPTCYINPDCTNYAQVPVVYICHPWGCNYLVDFTGTVNPITGNTVNVFVNTYIDSDGDGYPNLCPPGDSTCVPDNCIRYANPNQAVNACIGHPNPLEDDTDNDWYLNGEDLFPTDRTRH